VHATDVQAHRAVDPPTAQHDAQHAARAEQLRAGLDHLGVGAETDDVVETLPVQLRDLLRIGQHRLRGPVLRREGTEVAVADHQQPTTIGDVIAFRPRVGTFHGGPRLDQPDGGRRRPVGDVDQELLTRRRDHAAFVDDDVLLQRTLEVVAERTVRFRRAQVLPVGLHQHPVPHLEVRHLFPGGDDAPHRFVTGHRRLPARTIARNLGEGLGRDPRDHLRLARVGIEGVQQFGVAETDAAGLHLEQHLVRPHLVDGFGGVEHELIDPDDLDGLLGCGNVTHVSSFGFSGFRR